VLIVDDEPDIADAYERRLSDHYETTVAYGGEEALDVVDETVDAVLLDRRMPDVTGDEVLSTLREWGLDCTVIMVTAVDPDLNILDMDFDDYLSKPVDTETLVAVIDQHVDGSLEDGRIEEFFSVLSKIEILDEEYTDAELRNHEEFKRLAQRAERMADELRDEVDDFDALVDTYRNVGRTTDHSGDEGDG
jgi:DNA-binding response OmpR family regulator